MTFANIAVYALLIAYILHKRMVGRPVGTTKKLFALPVIVTVIGWGSASKGSTRTVDIVVAVIGCAASLLFGMVRGRADRLTERDGAPYVQWTWLSIAVFAANIAAKLVLDVAGVAAGGTFSAASRSLVLSFGFTLLGEAAVLWFRTGGVAQLAQVQHPDDRHLAK